MRTAIVYNFLIEANIMASIAILLMIVFRKVLRKQLGNKAICFGWLLIAIRLLCPLTLPNPLINQIRSPYAIDPAIRPIAGQVKVRFEDLLDGVVDVEYTSGNQTWLNRVNSIRNDVSNANLSILLAKIWVIGFLAVLLWFVISNIWFRRKMHVGRIEPISGKLLDEYTDLCKQRNIKQLPVYFTDPLPSACLVGVLRPYIALPLTSKPQETIHVLTHEVCHYANHDNLWGVLRLLCCMVHWFNPLVWIAATLSRTDSELRCDDRVVARMNLSERKEYANVLVLAAARKNMPGIGVMATGMTMTGKRLQNRVLTVLTERHAKRWLTIAFVFLASLCLIATFCTSESGISFRKFVEFDNSEAIHLVPEHQTREMAENLQEWEKEIWTCAGYDYEEMRQYRNIGEGRIWEDAGTLTRVHYENDQLNRYCTFAEDGTLLEMQESDAPWLKDEALRASVKYVQDESAIQKLSDRLIDFLESVNPGMSRTIDHMEVVKECTLDGQTWVFIDGIPKDTQNGEWIVFVVRVEPEWQIQYLSCISNG